MALEPVDPIGFALPPTIFKAEPSEHHLQMQIRAINQECSKRDWSPKTFGTQGHIVANKSTEEWIRN